MPTSDDASRKIAAMVAKSMLCGFLLILSLAAPATAMDISIQQLPNGFHAVSAKGIITSGDFERLRRALQFADRDEHGYKDVLLDSVGGLVNEALAMAALMDKEKVTTGVMAGAECASACSAILFLSGVYRYVFDGGRFGIHSCSAGGNRADFCNEVIADNAFRHGIPNGTVMAFMKQRGPSDIEWFNSEEADCWGFTLYPPDYHRGIKRGAATLVGISWSAQAQQQPCSPPRNIFGQLHGIGARSNPSIAAQDDFEQAVCEYKNCITANPNNINACEGLRHIMDASAAAAAKQRN